MRRDITRRTRPRDYDNPVTLTAIATAGFVYGVAYFVGDLTNYDGESLQLIQIGDGLPVALYGLIWAVSAGVGLLGMFSRRLFSLGFTTLAAVMAGWSLLYLVLFIFDDDPNDAFGLLVSSGWWAAHALATYTLTVHERTLTNLAITDKAIDEQRIKTKETLKE